MRVNEAKKLVEAGVEYVCNHHEIMLFRKRKLARALVSAILGTLIKNTERGPKKVKSISRTNTSTK
jgi:nitroreductase